MDKSGANSSEEQVVTPLFRLLRIYRAAGFEVQTGLNSYHFHGWRDAPFTLLYRNGKLIDTGGGGLSLHEIPFLEHLSIVADVRSIFVVGNSFGWSSLLLGLLWPKAEVLALDCGMLPTQHWLQRLFHKTVKLISGEPDPEPVPSDFGIVLTNRLAKEHGLNVRVVQGMSPADVKPAIEQHLTRRPDLVFIDGYHTPDQVLLDFKAAAEVASSDCLYLFHDVINWKLERSFETILQSPGMVGSLLWRTPSGFGFLSPESRSDQFRELVSAFNEPPDVIARLKAQVPRKMLADKVARLILHSRVMHGLKSLLIWNRESARPSNKSKGADSGR